MKLRIVFIFLFLYTLISAQNNLKTGSVVKEKITSLDKNNLPHYDNVPHQRYVLLYRYSGADGVSDNADSIKLLMQIAADIVQKLKSLPEFQNLKKLNDNEYLDIIFHAQVKSYKDIAGIEKKMINDENTANLGKRRFVHHYIFPEESKIKPSSVLRSEKLCLINPKGLVLSLSQLGNFTYAPRAIDGTTLRGKLLSENKGKKSPLPKTKVTITKNDQSKISETYTDKYGDFEIVIPEGFDYILTAQPDSKEIKIVILASQNGVEIGKFKKTANGFQYPLLKADILKLSDMEVNEDISLSFTKIKESSSGNINITENINYASGQFKIQKESEETLNKVAAILKDNPEVKLEVISHTDSRGKDNENMSLSQKRSGAVVEYLVAKGIDRSRLKASGKGESAIRNRCANGVECSDREHEYNRRTEFNFSRD